MSTTDSDGYARYDWWGDVDDTPDRQGHAPPQEGPPPGYDHDLARWKAHYILKDTAEKVCGLTLSEAGREVELTEPCICPPRDHEYHGHLRYNPESGHITGPFSTWVHLADRPRGEFMDVIETCLDLWRVHPGLSEREVDALRSKAGELKGRQDTTDEGVLATLIEAVVTPVPVTDYDW